MEFTDRELSCVECNESFTFSSEDQSYHAEKGYENDPKRCRTCRAVRRSNRNSMGGGGFGNRRPREMHTIECADCNKESTVPFRPRGDRPVYCSDCYESRGGKTSSPEATESTE